MKQNYRTIPFDMLNDVRYIDSIISNDAISVFLDREGVLHNSCHEQPPTIPLSLFDYPLKDSLRRLSIDR